MLQDQFPGGARSALLMLVPRAWRNILAVRRRQGLRRLAELDDRLLADIGIARSDLPAVGRAPLLRDPTKRLAQRARDRRDAPASDRRMWFGRNTGDSRGNRRRRRRPDSGPLARPTPRTT